MPVYGYYHFSGAKTAVNSVRQMSQTAESLKNKAVEATPSVKSMMHFLRQAAYSYTGLSFLCVSGMPRGTSLTQILPTSPAAFPGAKHAVDLTVRGLLHNSNVVLSREADLAFPPHSSTRLTRSQRRMDQRLKRF